MHISSVIIALPLRPLCKAGRAVCLLRGARRAGRGTPGSGCAGGLKDEERCSRLLFRPAQARNTRTPDKRLAACAGHMIQIPVLYQGRSTSGRAGCSGLGVAGFLIGSEAF